jgi:hypothetical protein
MTDFHDHDETTTDFSRDQTTLCGADPQCGEPGAFTDASGFAACREHGGVAPRDLSPDTRRLVASATARRDYGAVARILGDADVDLAWLARELSPTILTAVVADESALLDALADEARSQVVLAPRPPAPTVLRRAHPLAVDLVRLGVEPENLIPYLPPATLADSPRAQLRRERVARAMRALHCGPTVDAVPDELRDCYRRHGEVLAERDALKERVADLEAERDALIAHAARLTEALSREDLRDPLRARIEWLEAERDDLVKSLREALTYDQFKDL